MSVIIECPACASRYEVDAGMIGDGRVVRCTVCDNEWWAAPGSGEALPNVLPEAADTPPDTGADDGAGGFGDGFRHAADAPASAGPAAAETSGAAPYRTMAERIAGVAAPFEPADSTGGNEEHAAAGWQVPGVTDAAPAQAAYAVVAEQPFTSDGARSAAYAADSEDIQAALDADIAADDAFAARYAEMRSAVQAGDTVQATQGEPAASETENAIIASELAAALADSLTTAQSQHAPAPQAALHHAGQRPSDQSQAFEDEMDEALNRQQAERAGADPRLAAAQARATRARGRGGLALAAAWGLFLCIAGGTLAGAYAFRDAVVAALPGAAQLYQAAGLATLPPMQVSDVTQSWAQADGQPVLIIGGVVTNTTALASVPPPLMLTIVTDSAEPQTVQTPITEAAIAPGESAPFSVELSSPPPDIARVELAFAAAER